MIVDPLENLLLAIGLFMLGCASAPEESVPNGVELLPSTGGASAGGSHGAGGFFGTGGSAALGGSAAGGFPGAGGGPTAGGSDPGTGGTSGSPTPLTIFIAGDSTVSTYVDTPSPVDQAGWGQMLGAEFGSLVTIDNRAVGGRTARWFSMERRVEAIVADAEPGDYLLVQFGTNDSHPSATFTVDAVTYPRYAAPGTDFKAHLWDLYVTPGRAAGLHVAFVTPPPRNSAYCGKGNSLGGYAEAMRELGEAEDVPVLDLNAKVFGHLSAICPSPSPEDFFFVRSDGTVDGTHFQENGARHMARFVADEIALRRLPLARYLTP